MTTQTIATIRTALQDRLDKAAAAIELIQSCLDNHLVEKDAKRLKGLAAVMRDARDQLNALMDAETAYDRSTFLSLAGERLSMIRRERAAKVKAKRLRREENERARQLFLADLGRLQPQAA